MTAVNNFNTWYIILYEVNVMIVNSLWKINIKVVRPEAIKRLGWAKYALIRDTIYIKSIDYTYEIIIYET